MTKKPVKVKSYVTGGKNIPTQIREKIETDHLEIEAVESKFYKEGVIIDVWIKSRVVTGNELEMIKLSIKSVVKKPVKLVFVDYIHKSLRFQSRK